MSAENPWQMPATGRFRSAFGPRDAPVPGASTFHRGVDIAPPEPGQTGQPVRAVAGGTVCKSTKHKVRGFFVQVRHEDGSTTHYQHLAEPGAPLDRAVVAGEQIGTMGATGNPLVGIHLHFKTYPAGAKSNLDNTDVDPELFMTERRVNLRTGQVAAPTPQTQEDDDMASMIRIIYDLGRGRSRAFGSTAIYNETLGWVQTSTGTGPRDELDAYTASAGSLGFKISTVRVNRDGWLLSQRWARP